MCMRALCLKCLCFLRFLLLVLLLSVCSFFPLLNRFLTKGQNALVELQTQRPIALELYKDFKELGRFMLRYSGSTIAAGVVTEVFKVAGFYIHGYGVSFLYFEGWFCFVF